MPITAAATAGLFKIGGSLLSGIFGRKSAKKARANAIEDQRLQFVRLREAAKLGNVNFVDALNATGGGSSFGQLPSGTVAPLASMQAMSGMVEGVGQLFTKPDEKQRKRQDVQDRLAEIQLEQAEAGGAGKIVQRTATVYAGAATGKSGRPSFNNSGSRSTVVGAGSGTIGQGAGKRPLPGSGDGTRLVRVDQKSSVASDMVILDQDKQPLEFETQAMGAAATGELKPWLWDLYGRNFPKGHRRLEELGHNLRVGFAEDFRGNQATSRLKAHHAMQKAKHENEEQARWDSFDKISDTFKRATASIDAGSRAGEAKNNVSVFGPNNNPGWKPGTVKNKNKPTTWKTITTKDGVIIW